MSYKSRFDSEFLVARIYTIDKLFPGIPDSFVASAVYVVYLDDKRGMNGPIILRSPFHKSHILFVRLLVPSFMATI